MRSFLRFFAFLSVFVCALSSARADGYFKLGASYMSTAVETSSGDSDASRFLLDLGAGYVSEKGWAVGGMYSMESSDDDPKAYGISGGWITRRETGFYALGTYFISAKNSSFENGWGYQADIGYRITLRNFSLAPQISYKKFTYDIEGSDETVAISHIDPMFVAFVEF